MIYNSHKILKNTTNNKESINPALNNPIRDALSVDQIEVVIVIKNLRETGQSIEKHNLR